MSARGRGPDKCRVSNADMRVTSAYTEPATSIGRGSLRHGRSVPCMLWIFSF